MRVSAGVDEISPDVFLRTRVSLRNLIARMSSTPGFVSLHATRAALRKLSIQLFLHTKELP